VSELVSKNSGYLYITCCSVGLTALSPLISYKTGIRLAYMLFYWGRRWALLLLALRATVFESGLFAKLKQMEVKRGNFLCCFNPRQRFTNT
jgi:hypothetical protein